MDWQRVSRIPFTRIRTLKREVVTAALEKHGESHSELKFSTGLSFFFLFSFLRLLFCSGHTIQASESLSVFSRPSRSTRPPPCPRRGHRLVCTADELEMSSGRIGGVGGEGLSVSVSMALAVGGGGSGGVVSTLARELCLLDGAHYSS